MEQELINMLELLREGLSELPAIGSDVFDIYVRGIQIEGGVKVVTYIIIISILTYLIRYFNKKKDSLNLGDWPNWKDRKTSDDLETIMIILLIALLIVSIMACFGIYNGLMKLFVPDYMLIKEVIYVLSM